MNTYKSYTLTSWQFGLLNSAMIAFGRAVGASWPAVFGSWIPLWWVIFLGPVILLMLVAFNQM
jgi:hypothetical protein